MKIEKKYIVAGLIGLVTISGALAYLQYKRVMDYQIKMSISKVKSISENLISFDLIVSFINKSFLAAVHVISNKSDVYVNDVFVSNVYNNTPFDIVAADVKTGQPSVSKIPINISFNPKKVFKELKINPVDILLNPEKINIKVATTLKIRFWGLPINIKDITVFNLKSLVSGNKDL